MKNTILCLSVTSLAALSSSVQALFIDEATFKKNGGDLDNLNGTITKANEKLRQQSYELPWLSVGDMDGCTATWIGDEGNDWSYFLTAAHCIKYKDMEQAPINNTFKAPKTRLLIAGGSGTGFVPPERIKKPEGFGGASTDIGILKLPKKNQILDNKGNPLQQPILNDIEDEIGRDAIFVGYGAWGVGTVERLRPSEGEMRLYARSRVGEFFEKDHGVAAYYDSKCPSPL